MDRKTGHVNSSIPTLYDKYSVDVTRAQDYFPFGMQMMGRVRFAENDSVDYRFGFNGQMKSDEIAGIGSWNSALFWEYDTRTATRKNRDPVIHLSESPYAVFRGNPIVLSDPNGDCTGDDCNVKGDVSGNDYKFNDKGIAEGREAIIGNNALVRHEDPGPAPSRASNVDEDGGHYDKNGSFYRDLGYASREHFNQTPQSIQSQKAIDGFEKGIAVGVVAVPAAPAIALAAPEIGTMSAASYLSIGSSVGNFGGQMITNTGSLNQRFMQVNWTGVIASGFLENPFGQEIVGSAANFRLKDGFENSFLFGNMTKSEFLTNVAITGTMNKVASLGLAGSGMNGRGLHSFFSKTGFNMMRLGTSTTVNTLTNTISGSVQNAIEGK